MKKLIAALVLAAAAAAAFAVPANATPFVVDAFANSSTGGSGVASVSLVAGQGFTVSVAPTDLWNAGALPRWSNADGLTGNLFATGSDESGEPALTLIGQSFGLFTVGSFSAPYGALVGEIGGVFQILGTNFNGVAWGTGTLNLFHWDSFQGDNTQFITADVSVPEPMTLALIGAALLALFGLALRRRTEG